MILNKEVEVKLGARNIKYYEELGYKIPRVEDVNGQLCVKRGTSIFVKVEDLQKSSKAKVDVLCDICKEHISHIAYSIYTDCNHNGIYCCNNCSRTYREKTCLSIYGVTNPFKSTEIKEKIKSSCLIKYGVENPNQCEEVREKTKQTMLRKYGVEHILQKKEYKEKQMISFMDTMYKNNSFPTSSQQLAVYDMLREYYGTNIVSLNFPCGNCALDVVVEFDNVCINIEYDGAYWHRDIQKDRKRDEFVKTQGYKILRIKSNKMIPNFNDLIDKIENLQNSNHTYDEIVLSDWNTIQNNCDDNQINIGDESLDIELIN